MKTNNLPNSFVLTSTTDLAIIANKMFDENKRQKIFLVNVLMSVKETAVLLFLRKKTNFPAKYAHQKTSHKIRVLFLEKFSVWTRAQSDEMLSEKKNCPSNRTVT